MKRGILLILFFGAILQGFDQTSGDFRSNVASGNWNATGTWQTYNGSTWGAASSTPGATSNVYIQTGHTVTLTQNESCNNLNISNGTASGGSGTDGVCALATNTLSVNGSLRSYYGAVGTIPGTGDNTVSNLITTTSGSSGTIKIVGSTNRDITTFWGAGNTGALTAFAMDISIGSGNTVTMSKSIKAKSWTITSGTLETAARINIDNGTNGDLTISSGAVIKSSVSGTGSSAVFTRTNTGSAGTLTVSGTLILTGAAPTIGMSTISFSNGTVEYAGSGQTLAAATNSGAAPNTYNNLKLTGTGTMNLGVSTTVNGTLTIGGTNSLALNGFTLTYGSSSILEYNGSNQQTTSSVEFPASGGPNGLKINNSLGVNLASSSSRTISGTLDLANGAFSIGSNTLTLNGAITQSSGSLTGGTSSNMTVGGSGSTLSLPAISGGLNNVEINRANGCNIGADLALNGALTLTNGALSVGTHTLTLNGSVSKSSGSLTSSATGTVTYNQASDGQAIVTSDYGNLTFSNYAKTFPSSGTVKIAGTFTKGSGSHTMTGSTVEFNGSGTSQSVPALAYNNLTLNNSAGTTGAAGLSVTGLLHVSTGTFQSHSSYKNVQIDLGAVLEATDDITVSGNWLNNGTFTHGSKTVTFNGSSTQTISGSSTSPFYGLTFAGSGGISLGTNVIANGTFTQSVNFDISTYTFTLNGPVSVTAGSPTFTSGLVKFGQSSETTIPSSWTSFKNLTINGSGPVKLGAATSIGSGGTLTVTGVFDAGAYVVSGNGDFDVQSGSTIKSGHASGLNGNNTTSGGLSSYSTSASYTFNGSSAQVTGSQLPATVQTLTVDNSAGVSLSSNLTATGMVITSGFLEIGPSKHVTATSVTNSVGTSGLIVKSDATGTGSLILDEANVPATVQRYIPAATWATASSGWHMLSSPVETQAVSGSWTPAGVNNDYDFYKWSETATSQNWINNKVTPVGSFVPGTGYMVAYQAAGTKAFVNELNVAGVTVSGLTHTTGNVYAGWHLLGNPFPSAITWGISGSWNPTNISAFAKIWNSDGGSYSTLSDGGTIPAMNGFLVNATAAGASLTIPADARLHSDGWLKSSASQEQILLTAKDLEQGLYQETILRFSDQGQLGYNPGEDCQFMAGFAPMLYTHAGNMDLALNSLPSVTAETQVPVYFNKNSSGNFRIELTETIHNAQVLLTDLKTNQTANLTQDHSYSFTSESSDNLNRFLLHFSHVGIENKTDDVKPVNIFIRNGEIWLSSMDGQPVSGEAVVYNMVGQMMQKQTLSDQSMNKMSFTGASGYYILKVVTPKGTVVQKFFI